MYKTAECFNSSHKTPDQYSTDQLGETTFLLRHREKILVLIKIKCWADENETFTFYTFQKLAEKQ